MLRLTAAMRRRHALCAGFAMATPRWTLPRAAHRRSASLRPARASLRPDRQTFSEERRAQATRGTCTRRYPSASTPLVLASRALRPLCPIPSLPPLSPHARSGQATSSIAHDVRRGPQVYDGSKSEIYVDGVLEASGKSPGTAALDGLRIGCDHTGTFWLRGAVAELRIFSRHLTEQPRRQLEAAMAIRCDAPHAPRYIDREGCHVRAREARSRL